MGITFASPHQLKPEAVKVTVNHFAVSKGMIIVRLEYLDSGGDTIEVEHVEFDGADYDEIMNATIKPSHVGMKLSQALRRLIQAKVKQKKGFAGTED